MKQYLGRINYRLLYFVVLSSSFLTLLATLVQVYLDYRNDIYKVTKNIEQIQNSYLKPIATSLFKLDGQILELQLSGLLKLEGVAFVQIFETDEGHPNGLVVQEFGVRPTENIEYKVFDLEYELRKGQTYKIGSLHVFLDLSNVYNRMLTRFFIILATNGIKMFIASLIILFIFQHLLTKHLQAISSYVLNLSFSDTGTKPLVLGRKKLTAGDELEDVVVAINYMKTKLEKSLAQVHLYQTKLEGMVAEKTSELIAAKNDLELKNKNLIESNADLRLIRDQLITAQSKLEEEAHSAGMAEIATDTLHNIGNFFNSLSTYCTVVQEEIFSSQVLRHLDRITNSENEMKLEFVPKEQFIEYLVTLKSQLSSERKNQVFNIRTMSELIYKIKTHLEEQRKYATGGAYIQEVDLEEGIRTVGRSIEQELKIHHVSINYEFNDVGAIVLNKTRLIHMLHILVNNSLDAFIANPTGKRELSFKTESIGDFTILSVSDSGIGLEQENLSRIFQQGFTTKKEAAGLGLHNCANYVMETGGHIEADSSGRNQGTTIKIYFIPYRAKKLA